MESEAEGPALPPQDGNDGNDSATESIVLEQMPVRNMNDELERLATEDGDPIEALPQRTNTRRARASSRGPDGVPRRFAAAQAESMWSEQV